MKRWFSALLTALVLFGLVGCATPGPASSAPAQSAAAVALQEENEETKSTPAPTPEQSPTPAPDETKPPDGEPAGTAQPNAPPEQTLDENGSYTTREDVALYLHLYGHLPDNFITKQEAQALGWTGGSLEPYAPGKCIGGNRFGNYEGLLPEADGRTYTECDIDTLGAGSRGAKRIVFSNDGLIYYTDDHYESFTLLYGEETP
ncbi:MAG: ribonuclease domain-containing protein [Gemmiger sp.]